MRHAIDLALIQVLPGAGPAAGRIANLTWYMFAVAAVVVVIVIGVTAYALIHRGQRAQPEAGGLAGAPEQIESSEGDRRGTRWILIAGAFIPAAILLFTFVFSLLTFAAIDPRRGGAGLVVEVTGRRWWWDIRYLDSTAGNVFRTANEIRIPVGTRVTVRLLSDDVIHSFWVPSLQGKLDLVPGMTNTTWIQADKPGIYRGQCAEYCGIQHTKMAFDVVAMPPDEFASWLSNQRQPAVEPADSLALSGQEAFMTSGCALCHSVRGTPAGAVLGPDLTHLASRRSLAAGTIPNTTGNLVGWITSAQAFKQGSLMPDMKIHPERLGALVHYLSTLR